MTVLASVGLTRARQPAFRSGNRELLALGLAGFGAVVLALGAALAVPTPRLLVGAGIAAGIVGLFTLAVSSRHELTLALLALYLGLADGIIKLQINNQLTSSLRDVLIAAVSLGALVRLVVRRERIRLPPMYGWIVAFVVLVAVEALNPNTHGMAKVVAGFRQHLEWIPFFFFGYSVLRTKGRLRAFLVLLGVIALMNGIVSTIQTQQTASQLARWGPGYSALINGTGGLADRLYSTATGTHVRPPALGSDEGFGGYVGVLALPAALALLAAARSRRRMILAVVFCVGALLAIATSLQREAVLGAVAAVVAFAFLSIGAGRSATRPLGALLALVATAAVFIVVLSSSVNGSVFSRYASISPGHAAATAYSYRVDTLGQIPSDIATYPFGGGLATVGAAAGFGGHSSVGLSGESQYNYVTVELGLPGLLLWVALTVTVIGLAVGGVRRIADVEVRMALAAVFAAVIAFTLMGFGGPTMSSLPFGPFFWCAVGLAAYWFKGNAEALAPAARVTQRPTPARDTWLARVG